MRRAILVLLMMLLPVGLFAQAGAYTVIHPYATLSQLQSVTCEASTGATARVYADSTSSNNGTYACTGHNIWAIIAGGGGGGGTPGGTDTAVQVNSSGNFFGDSANFSYNFTTHGAAITGPFSASQVTTTGGGGGVIDMTNGTCTVGSSSQVRLCAANNLFTLSENAGPLVPRIAGLSVTNAVSTGTTVNALVKLTGAGTAVVPAITDTGGVIGVCVASCGTSGSAQIVTSGLVQLAMDGATTANDYVVISSTTAGDGHDFGSAFPSSGQVIGRVLSTNGGSGTYTVVLFASEINGVSSVDLTRFGLVEDARKSTCTIPSNPVTSVTCTSNTFTASNVGEQLIMPVAGSNTQGTLTAVPVEVTITSITGSTVANFASVTAPFTGSNAIVIYGHDDVNAWQQAANFIRTQYNVSGQIYSDGGRIIVPRLGTGVSLIGQQSASVSGGASVAGVSKLTLTAGFTFGTTVGGTIYVSGCSLPASSVSYNGTFRVTGWDGVNGLIAYNQAGRLSNDTATGCVVASNGAYFPDTNGMVIDGAGTPAITNPSEGAIRLWGIANSILNIGRRGVSIQGGPMIRGLQAEDPTTTGIISNGFHFRNILNAEIHPACQTINRAVTLVSGFNILGDCVKLDATEGGGDMVTTTFGSNPTAPNPGQNEIVDIYDTKCTLNGVCIDAASDPGSTQDGPEIYGGYMANGNALNQTQAQGTATNCIGIWSGGPMRYFGGLMEVSTDHPDNCVGVQSVAGGDEIISKFENHGNQASNASPHACNPGVDYTGCYSVMFWQVPFSKTTTTVSGNIASIVRDSTGSYLTITFAGGSSNPYFAGQFIQLSGLPAESTATVGAAYPFCSFNSGTKGNMIVMTSTQGLGGNLTVKQSCLAGANDTLTNPGSGSIVGQVPAQNNHIIANVAFGFWTPIINGTPFSAGSCATAGAGSSGDDYVLGGSAFNNLGPNAGQLGIMDCGTGTNQSMLGGNNDTANFVISQPNANTGDLLDLCLSNAVSTCVSKVSFDASLNFTGRNWTLGSPTASQNFHFPAGTNFTVSGTTPATSSGAGTDAPTLFIVGGVAGGPTTGTSTTAGKGSLVTINGGTGGDASGGTTATGGNGGNNTFTGGNGGNGFNAGAGGGININGGNGGTATGGTNGNGGAVTLEPGLLGTGGTGGSDGAAFLNYGVLTAIKNSPPFNYQGEYQNSGTPTFAPDRWSIQNVLGAGTNGTSTLTILHAGTSGTSIVTVPAFAITSGAAAHGIYLSQGPTSPVTVLNCLQGKILQGAASADPTCTETPTLGNNGGTGGQITFNGSSGGSATISVSASAGTINLGSTGFQVNQAGKPVASNGITTGGQGFPLINPVTSQKNETASADTNVLTVTPPAAAGNYRACVTISVSSATSGVIGWTLSWTDSNGNAQSNIAESLFQAGTAAPALTFTTNAAGNYSGCTTIDVNNAAAAIVVKWVGGGTTAAKMTATIEEEI